jgi:hypothetical protein
MISARHIPSLPPSPLSFTHSRAPVTVPIYCTSRYHWYLRFRTTVLVERPFCAPTHGGIVTSYHDQQGNNYLSFDRARTLLPINVTAVIFPQRSGLPQLASYQYQEASVSAFRLRALWYTIPAPRTVNSPNWLHRIDNCPLFRFSGSGQLVSLRARYDSKTWTSYLCLNRGVVVGVDRSWPACG